MAGLSNILSCAVVLMFFCLWVNMVCCSINITDVVSYQVATEGGAGEQQPGGESMEAEES